MFVYNLKPNLLNSSLLAGLAHLPTCKESSIIIEWKSQFD